MITLTPDFGIGAQGLALASIDPLGFLRRRHGDYKGKITTALRDIEVRRKELESLKGRLSERRQKLFETTVKALQEKNRSKAAVYASEHAEVRKVYRVIDASELALTQVSLRLQSMTEIGDAMFHMDTAFRSLKEINRTMQGVMPALDAASSDINSTFAETMAQMGQLSPNMTFDVRTENSDDLVEAAQRYADEQSERMRAKLNVIPSKLEEQILNNGEEHGPLLAAGDEDDESLVLGTIYSAPRDEKTEEEVLRYAASHDGVVDIGKTSAQLGIPADVVEQSMIRLVAQGKVAATGGADR